jgi:secretion/DNA translocation related TadE-like protein
VVAGLLVVVVVTAMGLADVARTLVAASRAQTAADAAALAATQTLAFPSGDAAADVARAFAERNGASLVSCTCDLPALEATVAVEVPVGNLLLSSDARTVTARARAIVDAPGP